MLFIGYLCLLGLSNSVHRLVIQNVRRSYLPLYWEQFIFSGRLNFSCFVLSVLSYVKSFSFNRLSENHYFIYFQLFQCQRWTNEVQIYILLHGMLHWKHSSDCALDLALARLLDIWNRIYKLFLVFLSWNCWSLSCLHHRCLFYGDILLFLSPFWEYKQNNDFTT